MSHTRVPQNLRYTPEHEWARVEADAVWIGITAHAQSQLGDIVFLELPQVGRTLKAGETFGVVESVKAVSDLYAPIDGTVVSVNDALSQSPDRLNADTYDNGWLIQVKPTSPSQVNSLLDADAYQALIDS